MTSKPDGPPVREMKVTTVRLGADLWALLDAEAARTGVSVSQYMREAALARAAFAAGARADAPEQLLAAWAGTLFSGDQDGQEHAANTTRLIAALGRPRTNERVEDTAALLAQSRQAVRKAQQLQERITPAPEG